MTKLNASLITLSSLLLLLSINTYANTDFALIDSDGKFHSMSGYNDVDEIVIMVASATSNANSK